VEESWSQTRQDRDKTETGYGLGFEIETRAMVFLLKPNRGIKFRDLKQWKKSTVGGRKGGKSLGLERDKTKTCHGLGFEIETRALAETESGQKIPRP